MKTHESMFNKKSWFVMAALIVTSFLGVPAAHAQIQHQCYQGYDLTSLQGHYSTVGVYGANVAIAFAARYMDGHGNMNATYITNVPTAGSTTGERTIVKGTNVGTYTVNCDGTGVVTRKTVTSTGIVAYQQDDFIITEAIARYGQAPLATKVVDAQRTPSVIVPGGIFLTRTYTLLPDQDQ
jgi:hypothetical protein